MVVEFIQGIHVCSSFHREIVSGEYFIEFIQRVHPCGIRCCCASGQKQDRQQSQGHENTVFHNLVQMPDRQAFLSQKI